MGAVPALSVRSDPTRLPEWIRQRPPTVAARRLLEIIAARCTTRLPDGSLVGAFGGQSLARDAGISMSTLWRQISRLEAAGFLVTLCLSGTRSDGVSYANQYGIPATPGALSSRHVARQQQRMICEDGRYRPQRIPAGQQPLFAPVDKLCDSRFLTRPRVNTPRVNLTRPPCQPDTGGQTVATSHSGSNAQALRIAGPPCQIDTGAMDGMGSIDPHNHGGVWGGARSRPGRSRLLPNLDPADLADPRRLLALYDHAVSRGLPATEANRIQFVAAAVHATGPGIRNPGGNFHASVRQLARGERLLPLNQADEDAALRLLRSLEQLPSSPSPPRGRPAARLLSSDARRVAAGLRWASDHHYQGDPYDVLARCEPEWTRDRWDAARAELEASR